MQHQDWNTVKWNKKLSQPNRDRERKENPPGTARFRNLDSDDPTPSKKISHCLKMKIQKGRQTKKMSQRDLAVALNVQMSVIKNYESGKAIPCKSTLSKIGRLLGVKL